MADHAISRDAAVQRQLDRLASLSPGVDTLGLERITRLLERLGHPETSLPPVFHVAGTNGKGSTCAFLRAALEAAGHRVHVYSSPHLVRFNERFRLAGVLIEDGDLANLLGEVLDQANGLDASFFEITTAAAFLAFSRSPADACIIEVGLGGRLDATNVIPAPLVCGIAQLGIDHQAFLGDRIERIAAEKAGIAKAGVPLVTMPYSAAVHGVIADCARVAGAPLFPCGGSWSLSRRDGALRYADLAGALEVPEPKLVGAHQAENLALAIAMLRRQDRLAVPPAALRDAARRTRWPARMQKLGGGPLTALAPSGSDVWLDGGHNAPAGNAIATALRSAEVRPRRGRVAMICGMLANKDALGLLSPLAPLVEQFVAVPVPGHDHHGLEALSHAASRAGIGTVGTAASVEEALAAVAKREGGAPAQTILISGSLYLAGEVLRANQECPE